MFSHVMIGSNDTARSKKFYDALFAAMGAGPGVEDARGRLVYSHNGGRFMVTKPIDGKPATVLNGGIYRLFNEGRGAGRSMAQSRHREWRYFNRRSAWCPSKWRLSRVSS